MSNAKPRLAVAIGALCVAGGVLLLLGPVAAQQLPTIVRPGPGTSPDAGAPAAQPTPPPVRPRAPVTVSPVPDGGRTRVELVDELSVTGAGSRVQAQARLEAGDSELAKMVSRKAVFIGQVRYEDVPTAGGAVRRRAVVSWTSAQRPDTKRSVILPSPLSSRFVVPESTKVLDPGTEVTAVGDVEGAIATAATLFADGAEAAAADEAAAGEAGGGGKSGVSSGGRGAVAAGSLGKGDPLFDGDALDREPATRTIETAAAPLEAYGTTTEGCPPVVDLVNGVVHEQSKMTVNGAAEGACSNSGQDFTIKTSSVGCNDDIDTEAKVAYAMMRRYYVDAGGSQQMIDTECVREATTFELVEDSAGCSIDVDIDARKAWRRSELVYINARNARVVVRGCQRMAGVEAIPVTVTSEGCGLKHDFVAGVSTELKKATYQLAGEIVTAQSCSEMPDSRQFAHIDTPCDPIVDYETMTAIPGIKKQIDLDGTLVDVAGCAVDPSQAPSDLIKTTDTCTTLFDHDVTAGQSIGYSRYYHMLTGSRTYATVCASDPSLVFQHKLTEPRGWENDDDTRTSKALRAIEFDAYGTTVQVAPPAVQPGEAAIPYTLVGTSWVNTGDKRYGASSQTRGTACNRYDEQQKVETWRRSDGTDYNIPAGEFRESGATLACVLTGYTAQSTKRAGDCVPSSCTRCTRTNYFRADLYRRDDGAVLQSGVYQYSSACNADCQDTCGGEGG